jgi:hypothetical protein
VLRVENNLGQPPPVPQINKDETAMVTPAKDPTHEKDLFTDILFSQIVAMMGTLPIAKGVQFSRCRFQVLLLKISG